MEQLIRDLARMLEGGDPAAAGRLREILAKDSSPLAILRAPYQLYRKNRSTVLCTAGC